MAITGMTAPRWEVGSEFHWSSSYLLQVAAASPLPEGAELYSSGRGALTALLAGLGDGRRLTLHLPSYFCEDVTRALSSVCEIRWYRDLPTEPAPDFATLRADRGDCVLALNPFGLRDGSEWGQWTRQPGTILIEDHSHDPWSPWAVGSVADYAIASLRKTLPLPDGAMLWSPAGKSIPSPVAGGAAGADLKFAAMVLKAAYLQGRPVSKDRFRQMQEKGEADLGDDERRAASGFTMAVLPHLGVEGMRDRRLANLAFFLDLLGPAGHPDWRPLTAHWPEGCVPFNMVLICNSPKVRTDLRRHLIDHSIFPAIHWEQRQGPYAPDDEAAIGLSRRLLTIALDFRYDQDDVGRVADVLVAFDPAQAR